MIGSSGTLRLDDDRRNRLDQRAARVAEALGVGLDLRDDEVRQRLRVGQDVLQPLALGLERLQLALDLDAFEPRQLAQADLEDVLGLDVGQPELGHQVGLGLVRLADDADHLVDRQQREQPAFEDVDAPVDFAQAVLRAARDRLRSGTRSTPR